MPDPARPWEAAPIIRPAGTAAPWEAAPIVRPAGGPVDLTRPPPVSDEAWYQQTYGRPAPLNSPNDDYMTMTQLSQLRQQQDPEGATAWQQELQRMVGTGQMLQPLSEGVTPGGDFTAPDTTGQRIRQALQPWGDEAAGVFGGLGQLVRGGSFSEGYDNTQQYELGQAEDFATAWPAEAGISRAAGAIGTMALPVGAVGALTRGAGMLTRVGAGGVTAGAAGFGYGATETGGQPSEWLRGGRDAMIPAAAVGMAAPVIAPLVARGASGIIRQFQDATPARDQAAESILRRNTRGMTPADTEAAQRLMDEAQAQGVPLTRAEALAQATNGRVDITGIQRVVEQSRGGNPIMSAFMSDRAGNVQAAMGAQAPRIGPAIDPITLGTSVQRVATDEITGLRQSINAATEDLYNAAEDVTIDPDTFAGLMESALFRQTLAAVRRDAATVDRLAGFPDESVAVLDAIKRRLDDRASGASVAGYNDRASVFGGSARGVRDTARDAAPEYGTALDTQSFLRRTELEPLQAGPIGSLSRTGDLRQQVNALFETAPFEGMDGVVADAVRRLADADPDAASALVRQHITQVFNESTEALRTGPNSFGGANFAASLVGNPQQARVLEAAVRALPDGGARWEGFSRLLEVLRATGRRQVAGSQTAFNQVFQEEMQRPGGSLGNLASLALSPSEGTRAVRAWYNDLRLGRNTESLATMLTDPNNGALWARIAAGGTPASVNGAVLALLSGTNAAVTPQIAAERSPFQNPTLGNLIPAF